MAVARQFLRIAPSAHTLPQESYDGLTIFVPRSISVALRCFVAVLFIVAVLTLLLVSLLIWFSSCYFSVLSLGGFSLLRYKVKLHV
jgi:hypothetical protein